MDMVGTENASHVARVKEIVLSKNRKCLFGSSGLIC